MFPQIAKPNIQDFRSHKLEMGGYTAPNTFRKTYSKNAKRSKYETIVKTAEEIANEPESESSDEEVEMQETAPTKAKNYTINDIMGLDKIKIGKQKKSKQNEMDVDMNVKSKGIKKEKQRKKKRIHEKKK